MRNFLEIAEVTYIKFKNTLSEIVPIIGEDIRIQVGETAICNGLVIEDPTSQYDDMPGI
jgi:hypothetical protein